MHKPPDIILDVGVNYYEYAKQGDCTTPLEAAKSMIVRIAQVPRWFPNLAIKFQWFKADRLALRTAKPYWDTSAETTPNQRDLYAKYDEFDLVQYEELKKVCDDNGVEFMATAFDLEGLKRLHPLVKRYKVASADITNHELLSEVSKYDKPVIISTGAASIAEIDRALFVEGRCDATLLHCVLRYPTPIDDAQLWKIRDLKRVFPRCQVGYSDHCTASSPALLVAQAMGAEVIEKHVTATPKQRGNDHYHAIAIKDLSLLYRQLHEGYQLAGHSSAGFLASLDNQQLARTQARRGVYLRRNVPCNNLWSFDDVEFLRPQGDGIDPMTFAGYVKRPTHYERDMKKGEQL